MRCRPQAEVQGTVLNVVDLGYECLHAIGDRPAVAVVAQHTGGFLKSQQNAGLAVIERQVEPLSARMFDQPVRRTLREAPHLLSACIRS